MPNKRSGGGLSPTQQAAKFLGVSVLAGAVMAGIALPAVGALGLAAKGSVEGFDELPANLKQPPLSQRTTILDSKGDSIATVYSRDRTVVDLKEISPYMQQAIIAIEDARFYQHGAIDLKGVLRALNRNAQDGGVTQGASTLTQQLVKNVAVEEAGDDPTLVAQATQQTLGRKINELKKAIQDFEAFFLGHILKEMRKTVPEGGLFGNSPEEGMMRDLLDEEWANQLAQGRGIGLAQVLYRQLQQQA